MVVLEQGFVSSLKTITLVRVRNKKLPKNSQQRLEDALVCPPKMS
jgi:hypothetical protein